MKRMAVVIVACLAGTFVPERTWSAEPLERYALIVGANSGSRDRPQLKYAISDAERFARVLIELGGVAPGQEIILRQPTLRGLTEALDAVTRRINDSRRAGRRTEMVVYYSGHADDWSLRAGPSSSASRSLAGARSLEWAARAALHP